MTSLKLLTVTLRNAACGLSVIAFGCGKDSSEPMVIIDQAPRQRSQVAEVGDRPLTSIDFTLSATELVDAFVVDKLAAASKYEGKWVQLTGRVDAKPGPGGWDDRLSVTGYEPEGDGLNISVDCRLLPGEFKKVQDLSVTQEVTLKGKVAGWRAELVVADCEVIHLGDDPAAELTAIEFTEAYLKSESEAKAKYYFKPVKVTGEILAFNESELEIYLKGGDNDMGAFAQVTMVMGAEFGYVKDKLSVGDTIVVKGVCGAFFDNKLELIYAHVLEEK